MASFTTSHMHTTSPTARRLHGYGSSTRYSLGVEEEFQLVDPDTWQLVPRVEDMLCDLGATDAAQIKRELMQSVLETSTAVCRDVSEAASDLHRLRQRVFDLADAAGVSILSAGTTPVSLWEDQLITDAERYRDIVARLQWIARRELIFGLHVHVGMDSADKCMYVFNRIREHLPVLLALSANSPVWQGDITGLQSSRIKIFDAFPRSGMPQPMPGGWDEYDALMQRGKATGLIADHTYVWWDVRPHQVFGTLEIRICDAQSRIEDTLALTSLIQALCAWLGDAFDRGDALGELQPQFIIDENRWSAARFGLDGEMVDARDRVVATRTLAARLLDQVEPVARRLGSLTHFDHLANMLHATGAQRQLTAWHDAGRRVEAIGRHLARETRGAH